MPLMRLELRNEYGLGDQEFLQKLAAGKASSKTILDGVAFSGLVGILRQLGDFAEFGAEIFQELLDQVMITSARGKKILSRVKKIEGTLPFLEDAIHRKRSYIDLAYETGTLWRADPRITDNHISSNDLPRFIMDLYDECRDPPRLYRLDKYDNAGAGASVKRYSDPSYFKRAWAASEPEKAPQIQREKKLKKIKRKYSQLREGEVQVRMTAASRLNSLANFTRAIPPSKDGQSFSAETSSVSEMRLNSSIKNELRHSNSISNINFNEQGSETFSDMEFDKLSVSNNPSNHDQFDVSHLHGDDLLFSVDDAYECDDISQDSRPSFVNFESSGVEQPATTCTLNREKALLCIVDFPGSSSYDQSIFEEVNESDNYADAHNTLESETESDSECQTKCIQSLFMGLRQNETETETEPMTQYCSNSSIEVPMALHDSFKNCMPSSNLYLEGSRKLELRLSTQEAGLSPLLPDDRSELFQNRNITTSMEKLLNRTDDQPPRSANANSEILLTSETTGSTSQIQLSSPTSILHTPTQLWTNGNLLGLQPSKPLDTNLPIETGECTLHDSLNNDVKSDKESMANGLASKHLSHLGKAQVSHDSLSLSDERILSRKYVPKENSFMKHSAFHGHKDDSFCVHQCSQEQYESCSLNEREVSQCESPDVLTIHESQVHRTTNCTLSEDSVENSKPSGSRFSHLPERNLIQSLQTKPSISHANRSIRAEPKNDNYSHLSEISTDNGLLGKSISSELYNSQNTSPPLEHMKIAFHPMNNLNTCNLKLELPDGCINEMMDENVFPSFHLFSGCTYPEQDTASESDDTFCKSYHYSTEDLLSFYSDSNSELWEEDDFSKHKADESFDDILSCNQLKQVNIFNYESVLKDVQLGYITNMPTFESLVNQDDKSEALSIFSKNATLLTPTDMPPPPPLPPMQWRLVRPSCDISEDNHSNMSLLDCHFADPLNINLPVHVESDKIIQKPSSLAEDGKYDEMTNLYEEDRREQLIHQIRDLSIQCKLKPCQDNVEVLDEKEDFLHQIRTKTFNLRHTTASKPSFEAHFPTTDKVAAILQKANAIRQACASSDEEGKDRDWSDG